ncbi:acyl-CoA synthetase (AMP-forming)/AMP-acid ligase II [Paraburkholderia youngii]
MSCLGTRPQPTRTPRLITLQERLFESAEAHPDAIALIAGDDTWTYCRLARYVRKLSQGLRAQGLKPGDRVALHLTNKPETVVAYYACMLTGMIAVPLNNRLTRAELERQLRRLQVSLYLGQIDLYGAIASMDGSILDADRRFLVDGSSQSTGAKAWSELLEHPEDEVRLALARVDEPALLLSTSGTTGEPKFVTHTQRTVCAITQACQTVASRPYEDTGSSLPLRSHIGGIVSRIPPILSGNQESVCRHCVDPAEHARRLARAGRVEERIRGLTVDIVAETEPP